MTAQDDRIEAAIRAMEDHRLSWMRGQARHWGPDGFMGLKERLVYVGLVALGRNRGLIGAFKKGWLGYVEGLGFHGYPKKYDDAEDDRRGRASQGYRPLFRHAWHAGWAWAQYYEADLPFDDWQVLQVLACDLPRAMRTEDQLARLR